MQLTKNFNLSEFKSHDGEDVPVEYMGNVIELAANLQVLRDEIGQPIHINSGYRSITHNAIIGGAPKSQHLEAKAADLKSDNPKELASTIEHLISEGKMEQGGIGIYDTFVHYDIHGVKARW